jgi:tetratricopeptide (TPR) repeat protein
MKGDLSSQNNDLEAAKISYEKAIQLSDLPGPIMRKLLFVYIDIGDNQRAIDYSNELLDKYPNDPDLYYNIGVLYQRITLEMFDPTRELFLNTSEESAPETVRKVYDSFKATRKYAYNSKDYFLQARDLELDENLSTRDAVSEMGKLMDQIDELFIPSIRETARSAKVELD